MTLPQANYLLTLESIRDRCGQVYSKAQTQQLQYFDIDESKLDVVIDHVADVTQRRFSDLSSIPPHSRLRHFSALDELRAKWKALDRKEQARRLIDLVVVSVLLDAGAGQAWKYKTSDNRTVGRSEGLAIASQDMFMQGYFSSDKNIPDRVDDRMTEGFQVTSTNPIVGLEGRSNLLKRLADVLRTQSRYFPASESQSARPGNLVDYLDGHITDGTLAIDYLWIAVMSLSEMWSGRVEDKGNHENLVPFHKLSQWLTYSLIECLEVSLGIKVLGTEKLTGLPEYRNGGLLIDHGLLKLKPAEIQRGTINGEEFPTFEGADPLIVEWRALTVAYLDLIHKGLEKKFGQSLALAQVLEGGTWTAGREIAARLRPDLAGPPIVTKSDGTLF
ncbi:hypothetical protein EC973_005929 [Apophysomyces ossiformis]|uniref:DUF1688-domain-containing protein n=1 Tax=Apophysomyces ossiformis TaxID=679940 RepID=A0A8H7BR60_9FUNG|nr:hypothetical protein EC973_005929 [Apophysomyces ossiformis]